MVRDPSCPPALLATSRRRRTRWTRAGLRSLIVLLALMVALAVPLTAMAQGRPPRPLRIVPTELPDLEPEDVADEREVDIAAAPLPLIIDTDPGVDDGTALIYLFSQPRPLDVLGIVTVAGNTDVDSATINAASILGWLGKTDVRLVRGAAKPLVQVASKINQLIHGPDGLWFIATPSSVTPEAITATQFYCGDGGSTPPALAPGVTVLALGPLTNVAAAIETCKDKWSGVRLISLGGAKFRANQTPVSEFNYWFDPEAARTVFANAVSVDDTTFTPIHHYELVQVPEDAFDQFVLDAKDANELYRSANPAMANLLPALTMYFCALTQQCAFDAQGPVLNKHGAPILYKLDANGFLLLDKKGNPIPVPEGQVEFPALPDPVAASYMLNDALGTAQLALVKVLAGDVPEYVRGQSIIGLTFAEQLTMIVQDAELNALIPSAFTDPEGFYSNLFGIMLRDPNNATVVTDVAARRMINRFLRFATVVNGKSEDASVSIDTVEATPDAPAADHTLLLPMLVE